MPPSLALRAAFRARKADVISLADAIAGRARADFGLESDDVEDHHIAVLGEVVDALSKIVRIWAR
jgi:hypothetical protein